VFGRFPTIVFELALATVVLALAWRPPRRLLAAAQWRGLLFWAALLAGIGGLAWWDWPRFFAWVHHPFFGDRSWRLPDDAYSLVLFPTRFWRILAAAVLASPVVALGLTGLFLRLSRWPKARLTADSAIAFAKGTHPHAPAGKTPTVP
jgi:Protein of unknown function (DUF1461)